jgi:SAM-dependent methyltransferase
VEPSATGIAVLKERSQIEAAKRALQARGLGPRWFPESVASAIRFTLVTRHLPPRPDWTKAWDLNLAIQTIQTVCRPDAAILDLGAYNSAIIPSLVRLRFTHVSGIDFDPKLKVSPYNRDVRYVVGDFHATPFPPASFEVVTAISTIEHGYDGQRLFAEVTRVLKPGGLFLASTDFWPDKIETSDVTQFGLSWTIFSSDEIQELLRLAASFGLRPAGPVELDALERPVEWASRKYTFIYLALAKSQG